MKEPEIEKMTRRLEAVLGRQRREARTYTLLTVLCTPAFVAIASLVIACVILYIMYESDYRIDSEMAIYTGMTVFLASALGVTTVGVDGSSRFELTRTWAAGAAAFLVLLVTTYLTSLRERSPACFGMVYLVLYFLVLGLVGQTWLRRPSPGPLGEAPTLRAFVLAVCGFIVSAYAELFRASWLWGPPRQEDIRIAARVLCRLSVDGKAPLHECVVEDRIERLLFRLKLMQRQGQHLHLTPQGMDFIRTALKSEDSGKKRLST